jgi:hypothetical protein
MSPGKIISAGTGNALIDIYYNGIRFDSHSDTSIRNVNVNLQPGILKIKTI